MAEDVDALGQWDAATYRRRLLDGGSLVTRYSHRHRMERAGAILGAKTFRRAVDVGAADGWYLQNLIDRGVVAEGLAVEVDPGTIAAGRAGGGRAGLSWALPDDPEVHEQRGTFDLVVCLETLEHVEDPVAVLDDLMALAAPGATLLVSVPIEVGPSLLLKQTGRWFANRGGGYGYERYPWGELWRGGVLGQIDGLARTNLHSHKGFDYRRIAAALRDRATVQQTIYSPVAFFGPYLASTVFWVAQRTADP